jgi:uncharacterized membrane protein YhiD involved in acid resistance
MTTGGRVASAAVTVTVGIGLAHVALALAIVAAIAAFYAVWMVRTFRYQIDGLVEQQADESAELAQHADRITNRIVPTDQTDA